MAPRPIFGPKRLIKSLGVAAAAVCCSQSLASAFVPILPRAVEAHGLRLTQPQSLEAPEPELQTGRRGVFAAACSLLVGLAVVAGARPSFADQFTVIPKIGDRRTIPLRPSPDLFIRGYQIKDWKERPYTFTQEYLQVVKGAGALGGGPFNTIYIVHGSTDFNRDAYYQFDVLNGKIFAQAGQEGRLLKDPLLSFEQNSLEIYVWAKEEDQTYARENYELNTSFEPPADLRTVIDYVKNVPFPEFDTEIDSPKKPLFTLELRGSLFPEDPNAAPGFQTMDPKMKYKERPKRQTNEEQDDAAEEQLQQQLQQAEAAKATS